jgi:hypothetical protein
MAIDYAAIQKSVDEDLLRPRSRRTQIALYADPAHLVYELFQNADDHGATRIHFRLEPTRLIVQHNATEVFEERHVKAIASFENSTSQTDLLKTGTFGLGFKSVFALTSTPRIYSGAWSFEICDLTKLRPLPPLAGLPNTETRFEFPFNHLETRPEFVFEHSLKSPDEARTIVATKFQTLELISLLFTRCLACIVFEDGASRIEWTKTRHRDGRITIKAPNSSATFRLWEKPIEWQSKKHRPVQIAIRLDDDGSPMPADENLVVTFPTSISTGMGIILNGPYRTTPARETVGEGDAFNAFLVEQSADLLAAMIREERNAKRLSLKFLEILPIEAARSDSPGFLSPIHKRIRTMLVDEPVLPGTTVRYVAGKNARIARGQYLVDLFSDEQLSSVYQSQQPLHWLSSEITETNTPRLYRALAGSGRNVYQTVSDGLIEGIVVRPEWLFAKLSADFLSAQQAKWLSNLYSSLQQHASADAKAAAALRPIVRLSTRKHVPLLTNGRPSAYLPTKAATKYESVDPKVLKTSQAKAYFTANGYHQPDLSAEVFEQVLPKYRKADPVVLFKTHLLHLRKILKVSKDTRAGAHILDQLRTCRVVLCFNAKTEEQRFRLANEAYFWDAGLGSYFAGNPNAWFVAREYASAPDASSIHDLFRKLGAASEFPRELCGAGAYAKHFHGCHERGIAGFHPDWNLDGLAHATTHPTIEAAAYIWNTLFPRHENRICGKVQSSSRQDFPAHYTTEHLNVSPGGLLLRERAWIPDTTGEFQIGKQIRTLDTLHDLLERDQDLLAILDEGASAKKTEAARALGISLADAAFINENKEEYEKWKEDVAARRVNREVLEAAPAKDRERRRQKLLERKAAAPRRESVQKLRSVAAHSSGDIDRQSLFKFYRNEEDEKLFCQICLENMPFLKRDGDEYSECVTLLTKPWAEKHNITLKVMTSLNLILCPTCSSFYREYVHEDHDQQNALFEEVTGSATGEVTIVCSNVNHQERDRIIHFDPTHLADIRDCLEQEDE